jgi:hypothetical protein
MTRSEQPRVIELIGLPGSGKTSLGERAQALGLAPVVDVSAVPVSRSRWTGRLRLFMAAPVFSALCYLCLGTRRGVKRDNVRRMFAAQVRYCHISRLPPVETVVLDEGPLHGLFISLFGTRETALSRPLLQYACALICRRVDVFVHIDRTKQQSISKLLRRSTSQSRFNSNMSEHEVDAYLADTSYDELLRAIERAAPSGRVVHVNAEGAEEALQSLVDKAALTTEPKGYVLAAKIFS